MDSLIRASASTTLASASTPSPATGTGGKRLADVPPGGRQKEPAPRELTVPQGKIPPSSPFSALTCSLSRHARAPEIPRPVALMHSTHHDMNEPILFANLSSLSPSLHNKAQPQELNNAQRLTHARATQMHITNTRYYPPFEPRPATFELLCEPAGSISLALSLVTTFLHVHTPL